MPVKCGETEEAKVFFLDDLSVLENHGTAVGQGLTLAEIFEHAK